MYDVARVRREHRVGHGHQDARALERREDVATAEQVAERLALEQLHHEERHARVGLEDRLDLRDVRVRDGHHRARLAEDALLVADVGLAALAQELQRDAAAGRDLARRPDHAHAALTDDALEPVPGADHDPDLQVLSADLEHRSLLPRR